MSCLVAGDIDVPAVASLAHTSVYGLHVFCLLTSLMFGWQEKDDQVKPGFCFELSLSQANRLRQQAGIAR